jgi:PEP-CTERM motif
MKNFKLTGLAVLLGVVVVGCLPGAVLVTVPGTANIFSAGGAAFGGGTNPLEIDFVPVNGNVLNFAPGISGGISPCATCGSTTSGDGKDFGSQPPATNITSGNNISGIQFTGMEMFLIGVFLGPALPTSLVANAPDFKTNNNFTEFDPLVGQTFFIGDGLTGTGTGTVQTFVVPTGATRLFLGFADGPSFVGMASMYADNTGSLAVNLQIGPTPEPGTVLLMMVGLAALVLGRKKLLA